MKNWLTGNEASSLISFIIKISKIPCPITLSSSEFETREFRFKVVIKTFFYIAYSDFFEFCDALYVWFRLAISNGDQFLRDQTRFFCNLDRIFFNIYIFFYITAFSH